MSDTTASQKSVSPATVSEDFTQAHIEGHRRGKPDSASTGKQLVACPKCNGHWINFDPKSGQFECRDCDDVTWSFAATPSGGIQKCPICHSCFDAPSGGGEKWTADYVRGLRDKAAGHKHFDGMEVDQAIADAHNATLK